MNKVEESKNYEQNPFLKLLTVSKKEKQQTKAKTFNDRIVNTGLAVSKSALRRRKRKAREALKPKMDDLWESLPDNNDTETGKYVEPQVKHQPQNQPNPKKRTGQQAIFKQEHKQFGQTLQNPQFRTSPFATLRDAISHNLTESRKGLNNRRE